MRDRGPWPFCKTPEVKCTLNYCDENGCMNRTRNQVGDVLPEIGCINSLGCACKEANGYPLTDCSYWQG